MAPTTLPNDVMLPPCACINGDLGRTWHDLACPQAAPCLCIGAAQGLGHSDECPVTLVRAKAMAAGWVPDTSTRSVFRETHVSGGVELHDAASCPGDESCPVWVVWNRAVPDQGRRYPEWPESSGGVMARGMVQEYLNELEETLRQGGEPEMRELIDAFGTTLRALEKATGWKFEMENRLMDWID